MDVEANYQDSSPYQLALQRERSYDNNYVVVDVGTPASHGTLQPQALQRHRSYDNNYVVVDVGTPVAGRSPMYQRENSAVVIDIQPTPKAAMTPGPHVLITMPTTPARDTRTPKKLSLGV